MKMHNLAEGHLQDLRASGLNFETISRAGIYSASASEVSALLGFGAGPAMVIPYEWNDDGTPTYARVKLNQAPHTDGKRYRSPAGRGNRLYISRTLDVGALVDSSQILYVTEGEKKVLKAIQEGFLCVGVSGVWSWKQKNHNGDSGPINDLKVIPWVGRDVRIVFDSDAATNERVRSAETALAAELTTRGARPSVVRIPSGPAGEKQGFDDFLEAHGADAFRALPIVPAGGNPPSEARLELALI